MKKILKDTRKTGKYLETLPKIYLVGFWARYGVMEFYYTKKNNKEGVPLIYDYYDANGTCSEWHLIPVTRATCGQYLAYTPYKELAYYIADSLNDTYESEMYYMGNRAKVRYNAKTSELVGSVCGKGNNTMFWSRTCNGIVNAFHKTIDDAPGEVREFLGEKFKTIEEKKDECE